MDMTAKPLFENLLREAFAGLPRPIRLLHDARPQKRFAGECRITRGTHWLVPLIAAVMSLPRGGERLPVSITITRNGDTETWARDFAGTPLRSRLRERAGLLEERMGPMGFRFALTGDGGAITWRLAAVRFLGLPLPRRWFAGVAARESAQGERYQFNVRAELPWVGLLVHYVGWLEAGL